MTLSGKVERARLKNNRLVDFGSNTKALKDFFNHLAPGEDRLLYKMVSTHHLTVVGKKLRDGTLLAVCSNTKQKDKLLKVYKERWSIEFMFKNLKTQGFHIEDTHMTNADRIYKRMAVVALVTFITCLMGTA